MATKDTTIRKSVLEARREKLSKDSLKTQVQIIEESPVDKKSLVNRTVGRFRCHILSRDCGS